MKRFILLDKSTTALTAPFNEPITLRVTKVHHLRSMSVTSQTCFHENLTKKKKKQRKYETLWLISRRRKLALDLFFPLEKLSMWVCGSFSFFFISLQALMLNLKFIFLIVLSFSPLSRQTIQTQSLEVKGKFIYCKVRCMSLTKDMSVDLLKKKTKVNNKRTLKYSRE